MSSFNKDVENDDSFVQHSANLAEEIENYPELKSSLQRYLDQPNMKRYIANEIKEIMLNLIK